jgi:hypothetical protein
MEAVSPAPAPPGPPAPASKRSTDGQHHLRQLRCTMTNVCRVTSACSHTSTNYSLSHASANSHNRITHRCRSTKRHIYPLYTAVHLQVLIRFLSALHRHPHRRLDQPRLTAWGQRDSHLSEWRSSHSHVPTTQGIVRSYSLVALVHHVWQCDRGPQRVCACTCAHVCVFMHTRVQSCDKYLCCVISVNLRTLYIQPPFKLTPTHVHSDPRHFTASLTHLWTEGRTRLVQT